MVKPLGGATPNEMRVKLYDALSPLTDASQECLSVCRRRNMLSHIIWKIKIVPRGCNSIPLVNSELSLSMLSVTNTCPLFFCRSPWTNFATECLMPNLGLPGNVVFVQEVDRLIYASLRLCIIIEWSWMKWCHAGSKVFGQNRILC